MNRIAMKPLFPAFFLLAFLPSLLPPTAAATSTIVADPSDTELFGSGGIGMGGGNFPELFDMGVGDTGGDEPNLGRRAIVKFDLSGLSGPNVVSATLELTVLESRRDQFPAPGTIDDVAPFTNPDLGDTLVIHIADYGLPDAADYGASSIGNDPGVLIAVGVDASSTVAIDVTDAVLQDLVMGSAFAAFRIQTAVETDGDDLNDVWFFASANHPDAPLRPMMEIRIADTPEETLAAGARAAEALLAAATQQADEQFAAAEQDAKQTLMAAAQQAGPAVAAAAQLAEQKLEQATQATAAALMQAEQLANDGVGAAAAAAVMGLMKASPTVAPEQLQSAAEAAGPAVQSAALAVAAGLDAATQASGQAMLAAANEAGAGLQRAAAEPSKAVQQVAKGLQSAAQVGEAGVNEAAQEVRIGFKEAAHAADEGLDSAAAFAGAPLTAAGREAKMALMAAGQDAEKELKRAAQEVRTTFSFTRWFDKASPL